jgi:hypothetical protein
MACITVLSAGASARAAAPSWYKVIDRAAFVDSTAAMRGLSACPFPTLASPTRGSVCAEDRAIDLAVAWNTVTLASAAAAKRGPCVAGLLRENLLSARARTLARSLVLRPSPNIAARIHQRAVLMDGNARALDGWTAILNCLTKLTK